MAKAPVKKATVFARVDQDTKTQAEEIFNKLGVSMSNTVGMFLRRVVMRGGFPFEVSIPVPIDCMTKEEFDAELQKGMDELAAGYVIPAKIVEAEIRKKHGLEK